MTTTTREALISAVIVDDTPDIRLLLKVTLEMDGDIEVVAEAGNGLDGVEVVGREQPDLVVIDLAMPVMDGLEALPLIRKVCPEARVVVLSGFESGTMAAKALDAGAHGYLQKGIPPAEILDYVRRLTGVPPVHRGSVRPPVGRPTVRQDGAGQSDAQGRRAADLAATGLLMVDVGRGVPAVRFCNQAAIDLLGSPATEPGRPLAELSAELVGLVERRRHELGSGPTLRDQLFGPGGRLEVALRVDRDDLVISIHAAPVSDETDRLRQAISTTAHEIRNPVTVLVGVAQAIDEAGLALTDEQRHHLMAAVVRQAAVLDRVTEDLLTAAQAQRGSLRVDVRPTDLAPLLQGAVGDLPTDTDISVEGAEGATVLADGTRVSQMMANLLSNALKYGRPPYRIRVDDTTDPTHVVIAVEDAGSGVAPSFRARLFQEFARGDTAETRGTGLGLFVVRSLALAQGGWADHADREGGGSVFTITLPAAPG